MKKIISKDLDFEKQLKDILSFDRGVPANIEETVKKIITDIKSNGDKAVIKLTNELDNNNFEKFLFLSFLIAGKYFLSLFN